MEFEHYMQLAGGLSLFLYGMKLCGESLQQTAGKRMRKMVRGLTRNRFVGLGTGFLTALLANSSSAVTLLVVSFVGAGLMTLPQGIGVCLGASIGTCVAVQLIAFKISHYALLLVAGGLLGSLVTRREAFVAAGSVVFAVGLIFFGIDLMADGLSPAASSERFAATFAQINAAPLLAFGLATGLAVLTQSSMATLAMMMALLMKDGSWVQLTAPTGIAWVIGANVGTGSTGLIGAVRSSADGKRAALAQMLFKVIGGGLALLLVLQTDLFAGSISARGLAHAHLLFNLANALLFLPLIGPLAALSRVVIRRKPLHLMSAEEIERTELDDRLLATPELALVRSKLEIVKMGTLAQAMVTACIDLLEQPDGRLASRLKALDDRIDRKTEKVTRFLTALSRRQLSLGMSQETIRQINLVNDIENMGDVVSNVIVNLALKLPKEEIAIPKEALDPLRIYHKQVVAFTTDVFRLLNDEGDEESARLLMMAYEELREQERQLRLAHIQRLRHGSPQSLESSAIYLDTQLAIRRITAHARDILVSIAG